MHCEKTNLCTVCQRVRPSKCAHCPKVRCSTLCKDFIKRTCKTVERSPYVCNSCTEVKRCTLRKYRYIALDAQRMSQTTKIEARVGIDMDPENLKAVNDIIRPLLAQNQSPAQIWLTHAHELPFSRRTFYRYNELGLFNMTAFDLPKKVRYKARKKKSEGTSPLKIPAGHFYKDFCDLEEETRASVVEMDTVIGCKEDAGSLLTLHLKRIHFQIGIKLPHHDCGQVEAALDWLEGILKDRFLSIFGLGLCDRGIEFCFCNDLENSKLFVGKRRMKLFYCDARHSEQKGSAEKQHVEFRKVVPKGVSIDALSNHAIATAFSHINSTPRRSLFGMSPMQLATEIFPKEFFDELGLMLIQPDEVILSPNLLK
ncbi:MAG: IS30 family transposase [Raoultibacter sp.]